MTKEQFLEGITNFSNHRYLLWEALEATKGPVLELGAGDGSTPYLREYCEGSRSFSSFDYNMSWAKRHNAIHVTNWNDIVAWNLHWGVVLVDHSPGEDRKLALQRLTSVDIIVIHDSEPIGWNASDYQVRPLFRNFKYVKDHIPEEKGAPWTSALSNEIDVTKWVL